MAQKFSRRTLAKKLATQIAAGADSSVLAKQIAAYLVVNKMTHQVEMLLGDISHELAASGQHLFATAKSARPLAPEIQQEIAAYLKAHYQTATVELATETDERLIGGVRIDTPDATRDATIRAKLRRLQQA